MNAPAKAPAIGDNRPALITADQLAKDFAHVKAFVAENEAKAEDIPPVIEDDEDLAAVTAMVLKLREAAKRCDTLRDETKRPYLDAGGVVQTFFKALESRLLTLKTDIEARGNRYLEKKREAERKRREEIERKAREEAEAARLAAIEAAKLAAAATEQAATESNVHTHPAVEQRAQAAMTVAAEAQLKADDATRAAAAKPADMSRTRTAAGTASISTKIEFSFDRDKLDLNQLRPFLREDELRAAINAIAIKNREAIIAGTFTLAGVSFYQKAKGNYR